ncbi:MAG: bacillithiol system redox-active protein YtxJ [Bacteroidetes bacterium]|nr:bacillithiol system redox-active protein YtxJ [Bacteroidota bacterium]
MLDWIRLEDISQLDEVDRMSQETPQGVAIFKHSTRCSISSMALNRLEKADSQMPVYFLDLLAHRDISDEIANHYQVEHESPQLLIIKDKKVVSNHTHHMIHASLLH